MNINSDLQNPKWIYAKGLGFLVIIVLSFSGVILDDIRWRRACLAICLIWSSARFYYFLFYVIERYVDPSFRFAGIGSAIRYFLKNRKG